MSSSNYFKSKKKIQTEALDYLAPNHFNITTYTKIFARKRTKPWKTITKKYRIYRNQIFILTRVFKENHYQSFFENNKTNLKKIWSGNRSTLDMRNTKANNKYSLLIEKVLTTNGKGIVNHFNTFVTSRA